MKNNLRLIVLLLVLMSLTGCRSPLVSPGTGKQPVVSPTAVRTPTPVTPTVQPTATATSTPVPSSVRTQYDLRGSLNYDQKNIMMNETIRYTNRSTVSLNELVLNLDANRTQGVFSLSTAVWSDGNTIEGLSLDGVKMTLPLRSALAPGEQVNFTLTYQLNLPSRPGTLCFTSRQVNLSNWYPEIVPYRPGSGWLLHEPGSVGEYQVSELANFSLQLQFTQAPTDLKVAASSPITQDEKGVTLEATAVRNITLSASEEYEILETSTGDIRLKAFVFPGEIDAGQASLETAQQALQVYAKLFGPYPRTQLTIVESTFADGMEYDGLFYLGQEYFKADKGGSENYLTALSAHETAHQWWYASIANDQALEPWLDESLATYSERLFYENVHPNQVDWWNSTRIQAYSPQGWVNSTIYDFSAFRPYVNAVYLRGAEFLQELRTQLGDEAFFAFLADYSDQLRQAAAKDELGLTTGDFFWQTLAQNYAGDLTPLKNAYFK